MERMIQIGKVTPKNSKDVKYSKMGLGFEKLDRNAFDPNKAYDKVAALGVKWIRIQSGWAKTEKEKGVYDFAWLDDIVDNLVSRGLTPWMCLCYGNGLYDEGAAKVYGCVGYPPIYTEEQRTAWHNYVKATVEHFKGRVGYYEVWNEPDGFHCWKPDANGTDYGTFVVATAKAIREGDNTAKIIGGSIHMKSLQFINNAFRAGMGEYIDYLTFHEYTKTESSVYETVKTLSALAHSYNPNIKIIQGESGSQSKSNGRGALRTGCWTERKQTKQLLRHAMADLIADVVFTCYFSCVDMIEAWDWGSGGGYFGVLAAHFDNGNPDAFAMGEYTPKPSYYALQTLCSIFGEEVELTKLPLYFIPEYCDRVFDNDCGFNDCMKGEFRKPNGSSALVYWYPADLMTTDFESTVTIQVVSGDKKLRLVDLYDGTIYDFPEDMIEDQGNGCYKLKHIPIKDYPMLLTIGDFI